MSQVMLTYIPVLHQGYMQLFEQFPEATVLHLLGDELAGAFAPVHKELRAVSTEAMKKMAESLGRFDQVIIADESILQNLNKKKAAVIIPDEVVTREVSAKYLPDCKITTSAIFLRWDKDSARAKKQPVADSSVSANKIMNVALKEGQKSSDWWRQVGAVALRDGKIIAQAHNTHLPSEQQPYVEGDPRGQFHKGEQIELTTAIHAEAKLVAEAAAAGLSLTGAELYVTDFPCPNCAKLIAHSGIKKVYFAKGYSVLDGERVLKTAGVEIIQIKN